MRRLAVVAAACLAAFVLAPHLVLASPSGAGAGCARGYSYGGYASRAGVHGAAASIAAIQLPSVASGHAAAWVGIGGRNAARGGVTAWLQTGLVAFPRRGLRLYVEEVSAGQPRQFFDLGRALAGHRYRVAVVETTPDVWQAVVDGRPVGAPAYVPAGPGGWRAVATAENWAAPGAACNSFGYEFERVSVLGAGGWSTLAEAQLVGHGVDRSRAGFSAES